MTPIDIFKLIFSSFWKNRQLILQMTKREVIGRYRGSVMGLLWSFFNPLVMLAAYTFVFGMIFQARWGIENSNQVAFPLIFFSGLIAHGLFAECVNRAPAAILSNANYVKKVVFPLEILPWITMGSALFHALISILVLMAAFVAVQFFVNWTILFLPLLIMPLILFSMGVSWFLASLGVFVRDIAQMTGIITTMLMFLSPIFYPISAVPEAYRPLVYINPLTFVIEQIHNIVIWGRLPDWQGLVLYYFSSLLIAWLGLYWFQKTRKGFADVL